MAAALARLLDLLRRYPVPARLALAVTGVLVLSFLPPSIKSALHSRCALHGWYHVGVFGALALLGVCGASKTSTRWLLLLGILLLATTIEGVQAIVYRLTFERADLMADAFGVCTAAGVNALWTRLGALVTPIRLSQVYPAAPVRLSRSSSS